MKKHILINETDRAEYIFTEEEILYEINRDRSDQFTPYTQEDIGTERGLIDALTLTEYTLKT